METYYLEKLCVLNAHRQNLENNVSKSIVHVIKHANFRLHRVHPDGVISKIWQLTTNLQASEFDFLYIKRCVDKKKLLVRHNKVAKYWLLNYFLKKIQKQPPEMQKRCSVKKVFLKVLETSQKNSCVGVSF